MTRDVESSHLSLRWKGLAGRRETRHFDSTYRRRPAKGQQPTRSTNTTMAGEGSGEIEANSRRLASTKRAVALASKNVDAAEKAVKTAEDVYKSAKDVFKAAKRAYKDAGNALAPARKEAIHAKKDNWI